MAPIRKGANAIDVADQVIRKIEGLKSTMIPGEVRVHITRNYGAQAQVEALQVELRYTCYHDCSRIEEPLRPVPDAARIAAARVRLRQAFEQALERLLGASTS